MSGNGRDWPQRASDAPFPLDAGNRATLDHLCRAIELTRGFALFFVSYDLPVQRDALLERLTDLTAHRGHKARRLDVTPSSLGLGLLDRLRSECDRIRGPGSLHLCGLERLMPLGDPHPPILGRLNLARDRLRTLACPLVIWLRDEALTRLAQGAPDLWAWRSGVFEFQPEPRSVRDISRRQIGPDVTQWAALSTSARENQIAVLEDLLQNYRSLGDGPRERQARAGILLDLSALYRADSRWSDAARAADRAFHLAQSLTGRFLQARAWLEKGHAACYHLHDSEAALASYAQALKLYQDMGDRRGEAGVWQAIGDVHRLRDEYEAALDSYRRALALYQALDDRRGEADVWRTIGDVQALQADRETALASYHHALARYRAVDDRQGEAQTWKAIGDLLWTWQADHETALANYERALSLYRAVDDRRGEACTWQAIGDVQAWQMEYEAALEAYHRALKLYQDMGDRRGEAQTWKAIGDIQRFQDDYKAALAHYRQSLALYEAINDRQGAAQTWTAIGDVQSARGDKQAALESYHRALALHRKEKDRLGEADTAYKMAEIAREMGEFPQAQRDYEQALALYRETGDDLGQANVLDSLGKLSEARGDLAQAAAYFAQALDLYEKINSPRARVIRWNLERVRSGG